MKFPPGLLIFGHRGASAYAPENTLPAFMLAAEMGAQGVELDLQITADAHLIVHHDRTLERTAGVTGRVDARSFAELRALDVGAWFGPDFAGERMPTPEEVVETVGDRLLLNFELINDTPRSNGIETLAVEFFRKLALWDRAMISSFNPLVLAAVHKMEPRITLGLIWAPFLPWYVRHGWWRYVFHVDALHPYYELITPAFVRRAHRQGWRVHTWTVNQPEEIKRVVTTGVDILHTDYPDRAVAIINKKQSP
jgi:glycerophosphoryl diester phosphodiesterase